MRDLSKDKIKILGKSNLANYIKPEKQHIFSVATHKTNRLKSSSTGAILNRTKFAISMNEDRSENLCRYFEYKQSC